MAHRYVGLVKKKFLSQTPMGTNVGKLTRLLLLMEELAEIGSMAFEKKDLASSEAGAAISIGSNEGRKEDD